MATPYTTYGYPPLVIERTDPPRRPPSAAQLEQQTRELLGESLAQYNPERKKDVGVDKFIGLAEKKAEFDKHMQEIAEDYQTSQTIIAETSELINQKLLKDDGAKSFRDRLATLDRESRRIMSSANEIQNESERAYRSGDHETLEAKTEELDDLLGDDGLEMRARNLSKDFKEYEGEYYKDFTGFADRLRGHAENFASARRRNRAAFEEVPPEDPAPSGPSTPPHQTTSTAAPPPLQRRRLQRPARFMPSVSRRLTDEDFDAALPADAPEKTSERGPGATTEDFSDAGRGKRPEASPTEGTVQRLTQAFREADETNVRRPAIRALYQLATSEEVANMPEWQRHDLADRLLLELDQHTWAARDVRSYTSAIRNA
jgi:hypothetical protein